MIYHMVSVRDRAADVFGQCNFVASLGGAIRAFGDAVNAGDSKDALCMHPEDFDLYELGTFDDSDGSFNLLPSPRQIAIGKDLVRSK